MPKRDTLHDQIPGRWLVERYHAGGAVFTTRGMILVTGSHLMSTIIYDYADGQQRASANAGPYRIEGTDLILIQDLQLHYDSRDTREHLLTEGVSERIGCRIDGERLELVFPSGNRFECQRAHDQGLAGQSTSNVP